MTWNTLADLAHDQIVTETHLDEIRQNIEHLGAMKFGNAALSDLVAGAGAARMVVGAYTGDGATTKSITGLGFQPVFLEIFARADGAGGTVNTRKSSGDGLSTHYVSGSESQYETDHIISLDADGFTVGDGTSATLGNQTNVNARSYTYVAWRA